MFIYIGNDIVIESKSIIAIFDAELIQSSRRLLKKIEEHQKNGTLFGEAKDAKSIILTNEHVYYSALSTLTLKNREELYETTVE